MKVTGGKQMEYISGHDTFKIVDSVDSSYIVWSIGEYMGRDDLIPMCQLEEDGFIIRRGTLKAIRLPECEVKILRDAACYGVWSLQEAQKALREFEQCGLSDALTLIRRELAKKSLPVFEKIYMKEGRQ